MRFLRRLWQRNARSVRYARHSRGMCGNARTWRGIVRTIYLLAQELHYTRELHAPISTGSLEEKSSRCAHARVAQQKSRGFKTHADTRTPPITPASARVVSVQCCGKSEIFEAPLDPKNILPLNMPVESFEFKEKWYFINRLVEYTYLSRRNSRRGNFTRESDGNWTTRVYARMHFIVTSFRLNESYNVQISAYSSQAGFHGWFERRNANLAGRQLARENDRWCRFELVDSNSYRSPNDKILPRTKSQSN